MEAAQRTLYDEVNYPSYPIYQTHPNRLATVATLMGMKPAPVERCRVLELGCFDGANLAAMAMGSPDSEFVGVDAAGTAIARGRAIAEDVGLKNLTLRHLDLMEMAPGYGLFDYIIVHGLYSWVPEHVRKQILAICKGSLAPQGVAYVSYNTFPGCHNRVMLREMMQFHNRDFPDPQKQMQEAMSLLKVLAHALENDSEPYTKFLLGEVERLSKRSLESVYHDELSPEFNPFYFHQFMAHAREHELEFLGEADYFDMTPRGFTSMAMEVLSHIKDDIVLREQYLDFMRGRHFRKTLLCHPGVPLNRNLNAACVRSYYVSTFTRATTPTANTDPAAQETFENDQGGRITSSDPLARALFWHLVAKDPERIPFTTLAAEVEERATQQFGFSPQASQDVVADIAEFVWETYRAGLIDLHLFVPPFVTQVSEKPLASPLARWQARRADVVSTLHQRNLQLGNSIHRAILALLDGSRDHTQLRADVLEVFRSGALDWLDGEGKPVSDMGVVGKAIDEELEPFLLRAAQTAVLMG